MSKVKRPRTRADEFAALNEPTPKDFDPEDVGASGHAIESSDEDGYSEDEAEKRAHYEKVGESKLRKKEAVALGPQYSGSRVSRTAILDEDEDDPFSREYNDESISEGSDADETGTDGIANGKLSDDEDDEDILSEEERGMDDGIQSESEEGSEAYSEADTSDDIEEPEAPRNQIDRTELRKIMAEESKTVAATVSQAAKADAERGQAVKAQHSTFDSLLNIRIKLQKALIATNSLPFTEKVAQDSSDTGAEAVRSAEAAAFKLWSTLDDLRASLESARTGSKRKRPQFDETSSSSDTWRYMASHEASVLPHRRSVLEKWSAKTRPADRNVLQPRRLVTNTVQSTITDVLNGQLSDPTRLIARTRIPRSCAPLQLAARTPESPDIYDDADFYSLLLQDLIAHRSEQNTAQLSGIAFQPSWQAAREAKTKRTVDTKASKGRKLRYTVHEKLMGFMAPEDRGLWEERRSDELFSSLFGRKVGLDEPDVEEDGEVMEEEDEGLEEGLRLFGR